MTPGLNSIPSLQLNLKDIKGSRMIQDFNGLAESSAIIQKQFQLWLRDFSGFSEENAKKLMGKIHGISVDPDLIDLQKVIQLWKASADEEEAKLIAAFHEYYSGKLCENTIICSDSLKQKEIKKNQKQQQGQQGEQRDESFHFDTDSYSYESSYDDVDDDFRKEQQELIEQQQSHNEKDEKNLQN